MTLRHGWIILGCLCAGCQVLAPAAPEEAPFAPAKQLWEEGQEAMRRGEVDRAIGCYEQSLVSDPAQTRSHLSLAAAYLEKGDDLRACEHLGRYVATHPQDLNARLHHAELLMRLGRAKETRAELERCVADGQERGEPELEHLIHCHRRLMEIARAEDDAYGMYLNRGIGLYLLARQRAGLPDPEGELPAEGLLCQAVEELTRARQERPEEARPCWYLYEAWSALAQQQPARRWLRAADETAPLGYLTPAESRGLQLACRSGLAERPTR